MKNDNLINEEDKSIREVVREVQSVGDETSNDEIVPIKVEHAVKRKFDYSVIVKWIIGIYIIGALAAILDIALINIQSVWFEYLSANAFMNAELSLVSEILRAPLIMLAVTIPFLIPGLIITSLLMIIVNKLNVFKGNQKIAYLVLAVATFSLISLSIYF